MEVAIGRLKSAGDEQVNSYEVLNAGVDDDEGWVMDGSKNASSGSRSNSKVKSSLSRAAFRAHGGRACRG